MTQRLIACFLNKTLLEDSHVHAFTYCFGYFQVTMKSWVLVTNYPHKTWPFTKTLRTLYYSLKPL